MIQLGSVGWHEEGGYTELLKLLSRGKSDYSDAVNTCAWPDVRQEGDDALDYQEEYREFISDADEHDDLDKTS